MVAGASVLAATQLLALVPVLVFGTLFIAVCADKSLGAFTRSSVGIAHRIILAQTVQCAIVSPFIGGTDHVALVPSPSLIAGALVGARTNAVHTVQFAMRAALVLGFKVAEGGRGGQLNCWKRRDSPTQYSPSTAMLLQFGFGFVHYPGHLIHLDLVAFASHRGRVPAPALAELLGCLLDCDWKLNDVTGRGECYID